MTWPQLFVTLPHLPLHVLLAGVQQLFWKQTWAPVQQEPLQHPGVGHLWVGPFGTLVVPHVPLVQVAALQMGAAGHVLASLPQHA